MFDLKTYIVVLALIVMPQITYHFGKLQKSSEIRENRSDCLRYISELRPEIRQRQMKRWYGFEKDNIKLTFNHHLGYYAFSCSGMYNYGDFNE